MGHSDTGANERNCDEPLSAMEWNGITMSDFDDFLVEEPKEATPSPKEPTPKKPPSTPKKDQKSLMELLAGSDDPSALAEKYGLDQDLSEKVLVPLLAFLDKYHIAEGITSSPTIEGATDVIGVVGDIAPVVRNAAEYFSGKKHELSEDDRVFLERIKDSQSDGMGIFFDDDEEMALGESESEEVEPEVFVDDSPMGLGTDPFHDGVDWMNVLGGLEIPDLYSTYTDALVTPDLSIKPLDALAKEAGLNPADVKKADTQYRINKGTNREEAVDPATLDLGLDEIRAKMQNEQKQQARTSKANFALPLEVPDNLAEYDPLSVPGYKTPAIGSGGLATVEEMMATAGLDDFDEEDDEPLFEEGDTDAETHEPPTEKEGVEDEPNTAYGLVDIGDGVDV